MRVAKNPQWPLPRMWRTAVQIQIALLHVRQFPAAILRRPQHGQRRILLVVNGRDGIHHDAESYRHFATCVNYWAALSRAWSIVGQRGASARTLTKSTRAIAVCSTAIPFMRLRPVMEPNFQDLKVMVIDDSKTIRRTAETLLKKVGCDVITATDGFDALSKIADSRPDIIFVDIMMPRLDGYQTCALIKNNSEFKSTPVIMLSSKDGLFDKAKGRIVGSDQYLTKPFSKNELLGAIEAHVGQTH